MGDEPGTETGRKIGTIVKTAIEVALPGVSSLLSLVWPKDKSDRVKVKKADIEKQLKATQAALRKQIVGEFAKNLQPIAGRAEELDTLRSILKESIGCRDKVGKMSARVFGAKALGSSEWSKMNGDWEGAKVYLKRINKIPQSKIDAIDFPSVSNNLNKVRDLETDIGSVSEEIKAGVKVKGNAQYPVAEIRRHVDRFDKALKGVASATEFYTKKLVQDISELADWAKKNAAK